MRPQIIHSPDLTIATATEKPLPTQNGERVLVHSGPEHSMAQYGESLFQYFALNGVLLIVMTRLAAFGFMTENGQLLPGGTQTPLSKTASLRYTPQVLTPLLVEAFREYPR